MQESCLQWILSKMGLYNASNISLPDRTDRIKKQQRHDVNSFSRGLPRKVLAQSHITSAALMWRSSGIMIVASLTMSTTRDQAVVEDTLGI